jgi:hypothetical protein
MVLLLSLAFAALAALTLPTAFLSGGAALSAAVVTNEHSGRPAQTPTPARRTPIVIGRPPVTRTTTPPPKPTPTPAAQKQGTRVIRPGDPIGQQRGAGGIEPTMPRYMGSLPPGAYDLKKLRQKIDAAELLPVEKRKPITNSTPFTADELKKKCGPGTACAAQMIVVDGETKVLAKGKRVPIEEYVAQLNQFEAYLNNLGYSLRTGPQNLGKIVHLKPRKITPPEFVPKRAKWEIFDPATFDPLQPIKLRRDFSRNPAQKLTAANAQRLQASETHLRGVMSRGGSTSTMKLPGNTAFGAPRYINYDAPCPCVECSEPPKPVSIDGKGSRNVGTDGCHDGAGNVIPCEPGNASPPGKPGESNGGNQSCGVVPTSCLANCLYGGKLAGHWNGINLPYNANEGGWFGGSFDLTLGSSNCGMNGALSLSNGARAMQNLYILGFNIPVLDANISTEWNGAAVPPHDSLKFFGVSYDPLVSFDQTVPGPGATIPIPPVPFPLEISSAFTLKLKSTPSHTHPNLETFNCNKSGTLGAGYGVNVYAGIQLDADINAFVARAGLTTKLVLVDDYFGLAINSKISPDQNLIEVTPAFEYRLLHLKGSLFFFVEVNYLFGSKRWDVLLFDYSNGFGTDGETVSVPLAGPARFRAAKDTP